jgi:omega-6 fatty acid desaturase (delta-12 desaturase)
MDARRLTRALAAYRQPSRLRSVLEVALSGGLFVAALALASLAWRFGQWWGLALVVPAGFGLVRLFIIQHDCGHGALFGHRLADDWIGRAIGVLTLTPYDVWRRTHAAHHASCGNLDERGIGDVTTLTVAEYRARSRWGRLRYRLYRNPLFLFGLAPFFLFFVSYRVPSKLLGQWRPWLSAMATNAGIVLIGLATIFAFGLATYILYLATMLVAATLGVWLFYVQHQFEETLWEPGASWNFHDASLHGSSHYDLPRPLSWLTGHIGIHHVHHLNSRIPFYRLPKVLRDHPELRGIGRLTLWQSIGAVRLTLWCEKTRRLISFRQLRNAPA